MPKLFPDLLKKAPPVFVFYLDRTLSDEETQKLMELKVKADPSDEEKATIAELTEKLHDLRSTTPIPVPLVGDLIGAIPDGYKQGMVKSIDVIGDGEIVLKGNVNSVTITLKTSDSTFINALFGFASLMFSRKDALPRVSFFSKEMVIIGGTLINMAKASKADTTEQVITLEMQRKERALVKKKEAPKEAEPIPKDTNITE
ncbi:MAG: hypothetical protein ACK5MF_06335 [Vibrio sp.]|uniref:hypothetical protein n=1 Tax=Vibrio sp. TaxID=678 RepID=UPI003A8C3235